MRKVIEIRWSTIFGRVIAAAGPRSYEMEKITWEQFMLRAAQICLAKDATDNGSRTSRLGAAIKRALAIIARPAERTTQNWRLSRLEAMERDAFDFDTGVSGVTMSTMLLELEKQNRVVENPAYDPEVT